MNSEVSFYPTSKHASCSREQLLGACSFQSLLGVVLSVTLIDPVWGQNILPYGQAIAAPIVQSGLTVELKLFAEMPPTSDKLPLTRVNAMTALRDGSGRLFVNDLRGKLYQISDGTPSLYMDFAELVPELHHKTGLGSGLGSVAFHPEFNTNGKFYTTHVESLDPSVLKEDLPQNQRIGWTSGVLTEWTATNPQADRFRGTRRELLRIALPTAFHGLQDIAFNPNCRKGESDYGLLYVCLGESGSLQIGKTEKLRKLSSPLGCILRIDPLGKGSALGDYGIPTDNPWANHKDPNVLGEIWGMGMRNPHRICWDSGGTGRMFFSEIGEMRVEEINIGEPGRDYGWPIREGTFGYNPLGERRFEVFALSEEDRKSEPDLTYPVVQYDHTQGYAISGGGVYRGANLPELYGKYIFGDIVTGRLFFVEEAELKFGALAPIHEIHLSLNGEATSMKSLLDGGRVDLRIGWDAEGEMYLLEKPNGRIYKAIKAKWFRDP